MDVGTKLRVGWDVFQKDFIGYVRDNVPRRGGLGPVGGRIVFSGLSVAQSEREVCHIVPQFPVCGSTFLHAVDADHQSPGITAVALWGQKEK